ncbi:MAG: TetR/AcrR family transcriptional regulator [Phycisphaerae bacterium]
MARAADKKGPGRPKSNAAASHDQILDAVHAILQEKSVHEMTIEEVAKRAGVGKPTIYKWWPTKQALVLDMFEERVAPAFRVPAPKTAEEAIRMQSRELVRLLNGFFGKVSADIIAEGQGDPGVLKEYRERYLLKRRGFTAELIREAQARGEFRSDIDVDTLIDMIYAPIYYRLLVKHAKLDRRFVDELVNHVMAYVQT